MVLLSVIKSLKLLTVEFSLILTNMLEPILVLIEHCSMQHISTLFMIYYFLAHVVFKCVYVHLDNKQYLRVKNIFFCQ